MTQNPDVLEKLKDIHLPDQPFYALLSSEGLVAVILIVLCGMVAGLYYYRKSAYKREALRQLSEIESMIACNDNVQGALAECNALLRRLCLYRFKNEGPYFSSLTGREWVQYLNQKVPNPCFDESLSLVFESTLYQPLDKCVNADQKQPVYRSMVQAARRWVRHQPWRAR